MNNHQVRLVGIFQTFANETETPRFFENDFTRRIPGVRFVGDAQQVQHNTEHYLQTLFDPELLEPDESN